MKPIQITDATAARQKLLDALADSADARLLHRVHCVLLLAAGLASADVARAFDIDVRTLQRWAHRFNETGLTGLRDAARPGRRAALSGHALTAVAELMAAPADVGWTAQRLRTELLSRHSIALSTRQCQRWLARLTPKV